MANPQKTVDYILEQMSRAGKVSARKMFGGYCIYCNEKPAYKGSKPYFYISGDYWEDDALTKC